VNGSTERKGDADPLGVTTLDVVEAVFQATDPVGENLVVADVSAALLNCINPGVLKMFD